MHSRQESLLITLALIFCLTSLSEPAIGLGAQSGFSEQEHYEYVEENWNSSKKVNFDEYWEGDNNWGGYHRVYPVQLNTEKLIEEDRIRSDCTDIRVASEGQLLGTRVQDNTCNTSETWVYFGNPDLENGLAFDQNESIDNIEVFYGNKNAGLSKYTTSVYNDDIATVLKPESAVGMYYGHHTSVYTNQETNLERNDRGTPEQEWSVDFQTDHGDTGTSEIHISDQDGNSASFSSGDTYTITPSNAPSWVDQGDTLDVYFTSQEVCYSGCDTDTSNVESAQWGYPVQFSNPKPAKSNTGSPVGTTTPILEIFVDEPNNNNVDVSFYDASNNNQIGSTQTISDSGTASVEWSGLSEANTYNWYAEGCSSGCKDSSTYEFDVNGIPSIDSINFYNSSTDHEFTAEAVVTDSNGDNDLDSCSIEVTDRSGYSNSYNPDFENVDGDNQAICRANIRYDDINEWNHLAELNVKFTISDSKNQDTRSDQNSFPNHDPEIESMTFDNYDEDHAFNVTSKVSDIDSNNPHELDSTCQFEFADNDGNTVPKSVTMNYNYGNSNEAQCFYDNINASMPYPSDTDSGFEPNEDINVSLEVRDSHSGTDTYWEEKSIPNRPPEVDVIGPKNGEGVLTNDAQLEIRVDDPEDDNIELVEYRDLDGNIIESFPNPPQQTQYTAEWDNLNTGKYEWEVEVSDKWDSTIRGYFAFERTISNIYRVRHTVDHQYSSLIVDEGGQATMFFESDVATDNRTVTTYVEGDGIDVEYSDGSTQKTYEVDTGEPDRFQLRISALDTGKNELRIITEDDSVSTNTTTTFPVYVRESVEEGQSVPGLSFYYLVFIGLFSSLLYFALL